MTTLEGKFKLIKKNFTQIDRREQTENKRILAIEKFEIELNKTYEEGKNVTIKKPWVEEHYNKNFLKDVDAIQAWFTESQEKQAEMTLFDVNFFSQFLNLFYRLQILLLNQLNLKFTF